MFHLKRKLSDAFILNDYIKSLICKFKRRARCTSSVRNQHICDSWINENSRKTSQSLKINVTSRKSADFTTWKIPLKKVITKTHWENLSFHWPIIYIRSPVYIIYSKCIIIYNVKGQAGGRGARRSQSSISFNLEKKVSDQIIPRLNKIASEE